MLPKLQRQFLRAVNRHPHDSLGWVLPDITGIVQDFLVRSAQFRQGLAAHGCTVFADWFGTRVTVSDANQDVHDQERAKDGHNVGATRAAIAPFAFRAFSLRVQWPPPL